MIKSLSALGFGMVGFGIVSQSPAACMVGSAVLAASAVLMAWVQSVR